MSSNVSADFLEDSDLKRGPSIWYGVQASIGGSCMKVMLRAMWPSVENIRRESSF